MRLLAAIGDLVSTHARKAPCRHFQGWNSHLPCPPSPPSIDESLNLISAFHVTACVPFRWNSPQPLNRSLSAARTSKRKRPQWHRTAPRAAGHLHEEQRVQRPSRFRFPLAPLLKSCWWAIPGPSAARCPLAAPRRAITLLQHPPAAAGVSAHYRRHCHRCFTPSPSQVARFLRIRLRPRASLRRELYCWHVGRGLAMESTARRSFSYWPLIGIHSPPRRPTVVQD